MVPFPARFLQGSSFPVALTLLAFGVALSGCERAEASPQSRALPAAFAGVELTDQDGKSLGAATLGGKALVVSFMFTSCPSVCPKQTRALSQVRRSLSRRARDRVQFLSVSVDPEHDSPERLARFATENGAALDGWSFAHASAEGTRTLTTRLAAFPGPEAVAPAAHTTATYVFDARGRLLQRYTGGSLDVARLSREIERVAELSGG